MVESGSGGGRRPGRRWFRGLALPRCGALAALCARCGYPERHLCCFGCSEQTRIIFIGSGGTVVGCSEIFLPVCVLISLGILNFPLFFMLFMGVLHILSGLSLIYAIEKKRMQMLRYWAPTNWVLLALHFFWMLYTVIVFKGLGPSFVLTVIVGAAILAGAECYCIAVVTHFRLAALEAKAQAADGEGSGLRASTPRSQGLVF